MPIRNATNLQQRRSSGTGAWANSTTSVANPPTWPADLYSKCSRMNYLETRDRALLRALFATDPGAALYLWADLDEPWFSHCRWFAAVEGQRAVTVILLFQGRAEPTVLSVGDAAALPGLITAAQPSLPSWAHLKVPEPHHPAWSAAIVSGNAQKLCAMLWSPPIHPHSTSRQTRPDGVAIRRWTASDPLEPLLDLYRDYPGNWFEPEALRHQHYYVVEEEQSGRLLSVAGTHALSTQEGVAALGDIVTRASERGKGWAALLVQTLCDDLHQSGCRRIGLHVSQDNAAAIACYRRVGFEVETSIVQTRYRKPGTLPEPGGTSVETQSGPE